jgi:GT2 family glycosyltransferase
MQFRISTARFLNFLITGAETAGTTSPYYYDNKMNAKPNIKTISALVVNHNGGREVIKCLDALYHQSTHLEEIIVVDNASTDDSPQKIKARFPEVKLILLEDNLNLSKAHNVGLQEVASDLVLILDDDVYVDKDCIQYMYLAHTRHSAAIVCPRILLYPENKIVQCDGAVPHFVGTMSLRHAYQPLETLPAQAVDVHACIGACRLVDRMLIMANGGFDEEYFFNFEDLELSLRMRALGHRIICEPNALVFHDRGLGTPQLSFRGMEDYPEKRFFLNLRQRLITILIYYRIRTLIVLFPPIFLYEIASLVLSFQRGWILVYLSALVSVFKARTHIRSRRRFLMGNRMRTDKQLFGGSDLPLARGLLRRGRDRKLVDILSKIFNMYWKFARRYIG